MCIRDRLQAFGSQNALHNGGYEGPTLGVKSGNALLILRKCGSGQVTLTVTAEGMTPASCALEI